jgi:hypothetical protein
VKAISTSSAQAHRVAFDLDVAFLEDVEQADLDLAGEVGQLVHREDAAVRPRQQAVVHRQLVAELQARSRAALIGSTSPRMSAMVTSGVASFST